MSFSQGDNFKIIFGLKVKQLRQQRGFSQQELADAVGTSVSYINEIEKGKKHPKNEKIAAIANALGVNFDNLISPTKISKGLQPTIDLLNSSIIKEFPLEIFGIDPSKLVGMMANAPAKVNAFIRTLAEIARNYDLKQENFHFAALRSYQELQNNYFEDIEKEVENFIAEFKIDYTPRFKSEQLVNILEKQYNYTIDNTEIASNPKLNRFRSILIPGDENRFFVNSNLKPTQHTFLLAKEVGFNYLKLKERSYTSSWVKVNSFEQVLNNFKASYFANALLINKDLLLSDLNELFNKEQWDGEYFIDLMFKYYVSPETFLYRFTSLLPEYFGLNSLFFLRINDAEQPNKFYITKELHLSGQHNPHANQGSEHYCRRWISISMLQKLKEVKDTQGYTRPVVGIQRSQYVNSKNEYLCITLARPLNRWPHLNQSVTIGLLITSELKKRIKFLNDPDIPVRLVNESCERCPINECNERAAQPVIYDKEKKVVDLEAELNRFVANMKSLQSV